MAAVPGLKRGLSSSDDVELSATALHLDPGDLLGIAARELQVRQTCLFIWRECRSRPLLGRSTRVIKKVSFHYGHPPMATAKRHAPRESPNRTYPHIINSEVD